MLTHDGTPSLYLHPSISLFIFIHPSLFPSIHPSLSSSIHLFFHPSTHLSLHPSITLFIHPSLSSSSSIHHSFPPSLFPCISLQATNDCGTRQTPARPALSRAAREYRPQLAGSGEQEKQKNNGGENHPQKNSEKIFRGLREFRSFIKSSCTARRRRSGCSTAAAMSAGQE